MTSTDTAQEQTRARYPDRTGVRRARRRARVLGGVRGRVTRPLLFPPRLVGGVLAGLAARQIPYFARHCRVRSGWMAEATGAPTRARNPAAYTNAEYAADALRSPRRHLRRSGRSSSAGRSGTNRALLVAAEHPERVAGLCLLGLGVGQTDVLPTPAGALRPLRRGARGATTGAWRSSTGPTSERDLPRSSSSSSRRRVRAGAALDQAHRGRRRVGGWRGHRTRAGGNGARNRWTAYPEDI